MQSDSSSKAVVFPWYDKAGFEELAAGKLARGTTRPRYDRWQRAAKAAVSRHLAEGWFVELVTIKPDRYRIWLKDNGLSDAPGMRMRYILELAGSAAQPERPSPASSMYH